MAYPAGYLDSCYDDGFAALRRAKNEARNAGFSRLRTENIPLHAWWPTHWRGRSFTFDAAAGAIVCDGIVWALAQ